MIPRSPEPTYQRSNESSTTDIVSCSRINGQYTPSSPSLVPVEQQIEHADDKKTWPTGWRPWATLAAGFLLMFNSWGIVNAYGTFLSFYNEVLLPTTKIEVFNLIGSTQSSLVLGLSFVVGRLLDAGYHVQLKIVGSIFTSLSLLLLSFTSGQGNVGDGSVTQIWTVQGLLGGLGMACFFVTSSQTVATWFVDYKGFAIGIVACGAAVAGVIYPTLIRYFTDLFGFITAVRYMALLCLLTCILAIFLSHPNPEFQLRRFERPGKNTSKTLEEDGANVSSASSTIEPIVPTHRPSNPLTLHTWIDPSALRSPPFLLFTSSVALMFFGFYGVFFNLEEWAAVTRVGYKGKTPPPCPADHVADTPCNPPGLRTYYLLAIMNGASVIGRLSSSYLCDHFGALRVHATVTVISGLLCVTLWLFARTLGLAIAFVVLFGAFSGSVIGLPPASMASILGNKDAKAQTKLGQWTGMMYTCAAPFALTGPVIEGYFVRRFGFTSGAVQAWSGACLITSGGLMWAAHRATNAEKRASEPPRRFSVASVRTAVSDMSTVFKKG